MELINKSDLVAEIERRLKDQNKDRDFNYLQIKELEAILSFLDTLEVKEVDLEKEIQLWIEENTCGGYCSASIRDTAEHFYDLGLKAKGE